MTLRSSAGCLKGSMRQHHKSSWGFNRAFLVMPLGLIFKPCFPDSNVDLISVQSPCFMLALSAIQRGWEWGTQPTQQVLALLYATLVSSSYILLRTTRRIQQPSTLPSHSLVWLSSSLHTCSLFHFSAGCQVLCCCVTKIPLPPESPMWFAAGHSNVILTVKYTTLGNIIFAYGSHIKCVCSNGWFIFSKICVWCCELQKNRKGFRVKVGYGRRFGGAKGMNTTSWRRYSRPKFLKFFGFVFVF